MAVLVTKPDKYAKCICCGSTACLTEYQFGSDGIKSCITLCSNCVTNMYKESQKEEKMTKDQKTIRQLTQQITDMRVDLDHKDGD